MRTDARALAATAYRTPEPLGARSRIYRWQSPSVDLAAAVIAALSGAADEGVVLDVGCGSGKYLAHLHSARPRLKLVGVDISPGMIAATGAAVPDVIGVIGSAVSIPLQNESTAAVLAMHMLYHVPAPSLALAECRRVLIPGGVFVASTNGTPAGESLWDVFTAAGLNEAQVSDLWPLDRAAGALDDAGFADVSTRVFDYELNVPTVTPVLDYFDSCRLVWPHIEDRVWTAIRDQVELRVREQLDSEGVFTARGQVGLATGRK